MSGLTSRPPHRPWHPETMTSKEYAQAIIDKCDAHQTVPLELVNLARDYLELVSRDTGRLVDDIES